MMSMISLLKMSVIPVLVLALAAPASAASVVGAHKPCGGSDARGYDSLTVTGVSCRTGIRLVERWRKKASNGKTRALIRVDGWRCRRTTERGEGSVVRCLRGRQGVAWYPVVKSRSCTGSYGTFRPDTRYGDVIQNLRVSGVSCESARRTLRTFYDYDRDKGQYRPVTLGGFRCRHTERGGGEAGWFDGLCTRGDQSFGWLFIPYTG